MRRALVGVAAALSAVAFTPGSTASAATSLTTRLSLNQAAVEVTSKPTGTAAITVAVMTNMTGQGIKYLRIPASQSIYTPPAAAPVVDMIADDSSGRPIGNWAGRLKTVPGGITLAGLTDKLSTNQAAVEVASKPSGTASISVAMMTNLAGEGTKYAQIPASQSTYTPPAATPVVDMIADDSSGRPIGNWAGRLKTVPGGVQPASLSDRLSVDKTAVEVVSKPSGTASIRVAVMTNLAGEGTKYAQIPASQSTYTPPAATPVVDMVAQDSSGNPIGNWAGRLQTTPPAIVEPPPVVEPPSSSMVVSLNAGGWGAGELTDLAGVVGTLRIDTISGTAAATYAGAGFNVIDDISGPYNSAGVKAINPQTWAADALARWKANPNIVAIEETNEPAGSWFWGPEATSEANVKAYAGLLKAVYEAFAPYGSARPKLLASYDGGGNKEGEWGARWFKLVDPKWIDGVTVHPYGGTGSRESSALGNRANVERAHSETALPVWVTEVGWPTAVGQPSTGDSLQWSWAEQASNISSFVKWCRDLGYVADVTLFQYRDYGTNAYYGIETSTGTRKPSYEALKTLAHE